MTQGRSAKYSGCSNQGVRPFSWCRPDRRFTIITTRSSITCGDTESGNFATRSDRWDLRSGQSATWAFYCIRRFTPSKNTAAGPWDAKPWRKNAGASSMMSPAPKTRGSCPHPSTRNDSSARRCRTAAASASTGTRSARADPFPPCGGRLGWGVRHAARRALTTIASDIRKFVD